MSEKPLGRPAAMEGDAELVAGAGEVVVTAGVDWGVVAFVADCAPTRAIARETSTRAANLRAHCPADPEFFRIY
jgi:hypothetical protein